MVCEMQGMEYLDQIGMLSVSKEIFDRSQTTVWKHSGVELLESIWKWILKEKVFEDKKNRDSRIYHQLEHLWLPWMLKLATNSDE